MVLTRNYGQSGGAGAVGCRFACQRPTAGTTATGPPPESASTVAAVRFGEPVLREWFGSVRVAGRLDNGIGLATLEQALGCGSAQTPEGYSSRSGS
jgi:hypothetical protein